jgi:4-nitrophenyl phosphatase
VQNLDLSSIDGVIFDMDGVVWRGSDILPGVPDLFVFLYEHGIPYVLASNNSSKNPVDYVLRAEKLAIPIDGERIVTSGSVTVEELAREYPPGTPIYVVGSDSLKQLLASRGYVVNSGDARAVVVGLDVTLTYEKIQTAGRHILAGAEFIGTNGDRSLPVPDGLAPGAGSILAAIQAFTGRAPRLMGKPEPAMFHTALNHLGTAPRRTLMIGDRLETDIQGAQHVGLRTALVLTGVSRREDIGAIIPDGVYVDLADLYAAWQKALRKA